MTKLRTNNDEARAQQHRARVVFLSLLVFVVGLALIVFILAFSTSHP